MGDENIPARTLQTTSHPKFEQFRECGTGLNLRLQRKGLIPKLIPWPSDGHGCGQTAKVAFLIFYLFFMPKWQAIGRQVIFLTPGKTPRVTTGAPAQGHAATVLQRTTKNIKK